MIHFYLRQPRVVFTFIGYFYCIIFETMYYSFHITLRVKNKIKNICTNRIISAIIYLFEF